jgi:Rrf2 family nitric oxide-sensitive transcriptional repressor
MYLDYIFSPRIPSMRLTNFTDYSLRVLIYLAADPRKRVTIAEVADAFGISTNHLVKVVHFLGTAGFLENLRGRGGGIRLAVAPANINVARVVMLAEDGDRPAECFDRGRNTCPLTGQCLLQGALAEAVQAFYATLARLSVEDLVQNRRVLAKVLFSRKQDYRSATGRAPPAA